MAQVLSKVHSQFLEKISKECFHIALINNWEFTYFSWLIKDEIGATKANGTLFRRNSLNSHTLTMFSKQIGSTYLIELLGPLIKKVKKGKLNCYEINPDKIQDSQNLSANIIKLNSLCQEFLNAIVNSIDRIPLDIKRVCSILKKEVDASKKFIDSPKTIYTVIGGFFFLRFLCPGLVSPFTNGIVSEQPNKELIDVLILVSKVLQNLANEVTVSKEKYMEPMINFNVKNIPLFEEFVDKILADVGHFEISQHLETGKIIGPIDETKSLIKFCLQKSSDIEKNWLITKTSFEIQDDSYHEEFKIALQKAENFETKITKIHPQNALPEVQKPEFTILTREEIEQVTSRTKKKLNSEKYKGFSETEGEAFLKIQLGRLVEKKKKSCCESLIKLYYQDKKYKIIFDETKKFLKEIDEILFQLERQEIKLISILNKRHLN